MTVIKMSQLKRVTPSIDAFDPAHGIQSVKTTIKSEFGVAELEQYEQAEQELYKFKLQLKGLKPEVANEIIRVVQPFFEDPTNVQLNLFADNE